MLCEVVSSVGPLLCGETEIMWKLVGCSATADVIS